jgi:hypothetical protein
MGIVHVHRGRLAPAILLAALVVLAVAAVMALTAGPAKAQQTFTTCASSTACHDNTGSTDAFHTKAGHAAAPSCATCHVNGFTAANKGVVPSACMTCHAPASDVIAKPTHAANACGTTPGCHGVPALAPAITSFSPTSGPVGATVTVTGTDFTGATQVTFNGVSAPTFTVVSATTLTAKVPAGATSGPIAVTTATGTGTSATSFSVTLPAKPKIVKLSPTAAKRGVIVAITGTGFGAKRVATSYVKFGLTKATKYVSWTNTKIKVRVPAKAKFGLLKVKVTTAVASSNGVNFRVKR